MDNVEGVAKINDRLRKSMSVNQLTIELSPIVSAASNRAQLVACIKNFSEFDPEIDTLGDHSVGLFVEAGEVYVFRFQYEDERYDYSKEIGKRKLTISHISEFKSLKLGKKIRESASRAIQNEA